MSQQFCVKIIPIVKYHSKGSGIGLAWSIGTVKNLLLGVMKNLALANERSSLPLALASGRESTSCLQGVFYGVGGGHTGSEAGWPCQEDLP